MSKINRRDYLKISAAALAGGVVMTTTFLYLSNEYEDLAVEHVSIPIKNLEPALEGFKIVLLADIHLYPLTTLDMAQRAVEIANQLQPDLTVLAGDYVWHDVEAIHDLAPVLAGLNARHGVYAALGNHDIWTDVNVVLNAFNQVRLTVLVNQGITITEGNSGLYLAGLDDGWSGQPDLDAALSNAPPNTPVVLLYHEPDLADGVSLDGRVSLQLAGHSHGGQVRLPMIGATLLPYLAWKYDMGLYKLRDMWLYTTRGVGVTNVPVRYNCPPEITELTLVPA
jgi:hypothetical protein